MKKVHQAIQKGNKWVRKTYFLLTATDIVGMCVVILTVGYVVIRSLIG